MAFTPVLCFGAEPRMPAVPWLWWAGLVSVDAVIWVRVRHPRPGDGQYRHCPIPGRPTTLVAPAARLQPAAPQRSVPTAAPGQPLLGDVSSPIAARLEDVRKVQLTGLWGAALDARLAMASHSLVAVLDRLLEGRRGGRE